jgi:DNA invertase Pin-like site-specific DNA recombinase
MEQLNHPRRRAAKADARVIGYARVSTEDQVLRLQEDALTRAGVLSDDLFVDKSSANKKARPVLDRAIKRLQPGDTFAVWRLDRLARNMRELLKRMKEIEDAEATFKSLTEAFDTAGPAGKLIMHVLAALAEFESQLTAHRTKAGMQALKDRGFQLGAQKRISDRQWAAIERALRETKATVKELAERYDISPTLIHKKFPGGKAGLQRKRKR